MVTLGSSSLAQNPGNLLYLDLPMPATAAARDAHRAGLTLRGARAVRQRSRSLAAARWP